jgi:hypothetical protein
VDAEKADSEVMPYLRERLVKVCACGDAMLERFDAVVLEDGVPIGGLNLQIRGDSAVCGAASFKIYPVRRHTCFGHMRLRLEGRKWGP